MRLHAIHINCLSGRGVCLGNITGGYLLQITNNLPYITNTLGGTRCSQIRASTRTLKYTSSASHTPPSLSQPVTPPTGTLHGTAFPVICYSSAGTCGFSFPLLMSLCTDATWSSILSHTSYNLGTKSRL